ncbi:MULTISPECIES: hypothetical protein [unclassified Bradyrhizobium]|uniref:hypothetical protein n=1 Tax=unclassified Bradyrhizobium TaxID=2631580 RepID=UPI00247A1CE2|nr:MULTISPECIES: hypothetical protein [unclassified Bradyrhizobium]WGS23128.1 hypothetical protein MTX22_16695 [Bradyrhizobium sp. ISRA463]WGS30132.1 hypothetical protein MTX19_14425 [Bradyrhizobium sp. ISRA464]
MITAAPAFPGGNRVFIRSLLLALFTVAGIGGASAQSSPAPTAGPQAPPVSVSGWSYHRGGSDVHIFHCEQPSCGAGSKVTYRLYAANNPMTLQQFRASQDQIIKALEQRKPGQRITLLGVDGAKGTAVPRMYRARRLTVTPDGTSEYQVNGLLFGTRASASLISSAHDEKASNDNYAKFAAAVMLALAPKTR